MDLNFKCQDPNHVQSFFFFSIQTKYLGVIVYRTVLKNLPRFMLNPTKCYFFLNLPSKYLALTLSVIMEQRRHLRWGIIYLWSRIGGISQYGDISELYLTFLKLLVMQGMEFLTTMVYFRMSQLTLVHVGGGGHIDQLIFNYQRFDIFL